MLKRILFLCYLAFGNLASLANVKIPEGSQYNIPLGTAVSFYQDSTGRFAPKDYQRELFQAGKDAFSVKGVRNWFHVELQNPHLEAVETRIWLKNGFYPEYLEIYVAQEGASFTLLDTQAVGDPFSSRIYPSREIVIPLKLPAGTSLAVLVRIDSYNPMSFAPTLASPHSYEQFVQRFSIIFGMVMGGVFISLLYNLLLAYRVKEKSLLYYSGYLAVLGILLLAISGFGEQYIWPQEKQSTMITFSAALIGFMLTHFSRIFLKIPEFSPTLNRTMTGTAGLCGILAIFSLLWSSPSLTTLIYTVDLVVIIASIAATLVALRRSYRPARMFALAWSAFFLGSLFALFTGLGLTETTFLSEYGLFIGVMIQMVFLAIASAEQMAEKSRQIAELKERRTAELEAEVARRTRAMREIVDNVASGFFLVARDQTIQEGFTESCRWIMGNEFMAGRTLSDCLQLSNEQKSLLSITIQQVFDDSMPSEVSLSLLPNRLKIRDRVVAIEGRMIRDEQGAIHRILFTANDATALVVAERQKKADDALIGILRQREAFSRFVHDFDQSLEHARELLQRGTQAEARHILHTLKGNASIFNLEQIVQTIHEIEESESITATQLATVDQALETFFAEHLRDLGFDRAATAEDMSVIPRRRVRDFRQQIMQAQQLEEIRRLALQISDELSTRPAREFLLPLQTMAHRVAHRLEIAVDIVLEGQDTPIDLEYAAPIIHCLPHLVRNSLSHGLEDTEERLSRGKAPNGLLMIGVRETKDSYVLEVSDDGRGIDPNNVGRIAVQKGAITSDQLEGMTEQEKQNLIFAPSFSTAPAITDISGRGIGMDAVLASVKAVGGTLTMDSQVGRGTRFAITLPRPGTDARDRTLLLSVG